MNWKQYALIAAVGLAVIVAAIKIPAIRKLVYGQ